MTLSLPPMLLFRNKQLLSWGRFSRPLRAVTLLLCLLLKGKRIHVRCAIHVQPLLVLSVGVTEPCVHFAPPGCHTCTPDGSKPSVQKYILKYINDFLLALLLACRSYLRCDAEHMHKTAHKYRS